MSVAGAELQNPLTSHLLRQEPTLLYVSTKCDYVLVNVKDASFVCKPQPAAIESQVFSAKTQFTAMFIEF